VDSAEFSVFYAGAHPRVVRAVYALTGDVGESQDAAQEAFVRAWDHRRVLRHDGNPEAWVTTTALRVAVSRWRRAGTTARALVRVGAGSDVAGPEPDQLDVLSALRLLPVAQREAIVLFHLCDLTIEQVAAHTGAPSGTVKARLSRGRVALAAALGDSYEGGSDA
jgi:RNA polymerase sigma-70 factor (ECF subfamily)